MATIFKRAPAQLSERRIDPWHYQPNFEKQIGKIEKNLGALSLDEIIEAKRGVAGGATPLGANYLENGRVKFYRTSEVEEMFLQAEDAVFISDEDDEKLKRSRLVDGDVLLTITGAKFGKSAVVSSKHLPGNISQHSVRFKPDSKKIDAHFLVAFLNGKTGQITIWREAYGATRPAIDFPSVRSLVVPKVSPIAQKYIGDKVRQAEQLRAWAKRLEQASSNLFADALGQLGYKKKESNKIVRATLEDRLDPAFYDEKYSFFNEPWFIENSQPLKLFIEDGSYGVLPSSSSYGKGGVKFIRATDLKNANIDPACFTYVPEDEVVSKAKVSEGDILMEIKGAISSCELADAHLAGAYVNGSIFRFTTKGINNAYLTYFLSSLIKELYCERVSVNNIISYLDLASIHSLPVVRFENHIEELLARNLIKINSAKKYAFSLTQCAKTLVEALIEGQLTEQQLIQAQRAMDDGDNSLDQAILNKLSGEGYAIEGTAPLFSDVEEFYRLLESAAEAEE